MTARPLICAFSTEYGTFFGYPEDIDGDFIKLRSDDPDIIYWFELYARRCSCKLSVEGTTP